MLTHYSFLFSSLASYLQHERDYLPLSTALKALSKIENVLKRTPDYGAFQKFVRKLIGETYEKSGGLATKRIMNGNDLNSVKLQVKYLSYSLLHYNGHLEFYKISMDPAAHTSHTDSTSEVVK